MGRCEGARSELQRGLADQGHRRIEEENGPELANSHRGVVRGEIRPVVEQRCSRLSMTKEARSHFASSADMTMDAGSTTGSPSPARTGSMVRPVASTVRKRVRPFASPVESGRHHSRVTAACAAGRSSAGERRSKAASTSREKPPPHEVIPRPSQHAATLRRKRLSEGSRNICTNDWSASAIS